MKIKKYKNYFCLCAISGCHNMADTAIGIKDSNGKYRTVYTCIDCSFKICEFNLTYI